MLACHEDAEQETDELRVSLAALASNQITYAPMAQMEHHVQPGTHGNLNSPGMPCSVRRAPSVGVVELFVYCDAQGRDFEDAWQTPSRWGLDG